MSPSSWWHGSAGEPACNCCQALAHAPAEPEVIDGGIPASGLVPHTLISRFANHLPRAGTVARHTCVRSAIGYAPGLQPGRAAVSPARAGITPLRRRTRDPLPLEALYYVRTGPLPHERAWRAIFRLSDLAMASSASRGIDVSMTAVTPDGVTNISNSPPRLFRRSRGLGDSFKVLSN